MIIELHNIIISVIGIDEENGVGQVRLKIGSGRK